ncbi:hypothetical protein H1R20_g1995, partial [Candolleomyces eurysporus]
MSEVAATTPSLVIGDENPVFKKLETRMKRYPGDLAAVQELIQQAESRVEALDAHIQDQTSAGNTDAIQALAEKKKIVSANAAGLKRRQGQLLKGTNKRPRVAKRTRSTAAESDLMEVDTIPDSVNLTTQSTAPPSAPNVTASTSAPSAAVSVIEPVGAGNVPQATTPTSAQTSSTSVPTAVLSVPVSADPSLPATPSASVPTGQLTLDNGAPQAIIEAAAPLTSMPANAPTSNVSAAQAAIQAPALSASVPTGTPPPNVSVAQAIVQAAAPSASIQASAPTRDVSIAQAAVQVSVPNPVVEATMSQVVSRTTSSGPSRTQPEHNLANVAGLISMDNTESDESEWFEDMDVESSNSNSGDSDSDIVELKAAVGKAHFPSYWKNLDLPQQGKLLNSGAEAFQAFRDKNIPLPDRVRTWVRRHSDYLPEVSGWSEKLAASCFILGNGRTVCQYHTVYEHGKKTTHDGNLNDKSDLSNPNFTLENVLKFFPMKHGRRILHCGCLYEHVLIDFWLWKGFALTSLSHPERMEGFGMPLKPRERYLFCLGLKSFCVTLENLYEYDHEDNEISHVKFRERHVMKLVADIKKSRREEAERAAKIRQQQLKKDKRKMVYVELAENVSEFDANEFFDD